MTEYSAPKIEVLGTVTDLTEAKPGIYFDGSGSQQGNTQPPAPGTPGTS